MWFNQFLSFNIDVPSTLDYETLFLSEQIKPCPPHARSIQGWLPVMGEQMVQMIAGATLFCMGKEERLLPKGVVKQILSSKIRQLELQQGRPLKRAQKAQMAEELEFELLPKSFCLQKRTYAYIDHVSKRLIIQTTSTNQAAQVIALIRKTLPETKIEPIAVSTILAERFTQWLGQPDTLPTHLSLAPHCVLFAPEDESKRFNCKGYEDINQEITPLLTTGLFAAEIALKWHDRVEFILSHDFKFKRLKCMDYLVDEYQEVTALDHDQQQDAGLTLMVGEHRRLIDDLLKLCAANESMPNTSALQANDNTQTIQIQ